MVKQASSYNIHPAFKQGSDDSLVHSETDDVESVKSKIRRKMKSMFKRKNFIKKVPIVEWLPKYSMQDAVGDLVAGITVGLTVIPQALAYAGIAQLPAAYGLYGSFLGCFVYILLGKCKEMPIGPTAIASLLVMTAAQGIWQIAVLLSLFCGFVELLMGLFGLGFLVDFISGPVSSGFTSAVALIIFTSQVRDIFGIPAKGGTFIQMWQSIGENFHHIRVGDTILGFSSIVILLLMRLLPNISIGPADDSLKTTSQKIINKTLWLIGTARNAIIVVAGGALSAYFYNSGQPDTFIVIGEIPQGLPPFTAPPFSVDEIRNETTGVIIQEALGLGDMISVMGSNIIVIPLIALLESIAICKAFANGNTIDASQELIAMGAANIANSFVQGYPGNGALSRGAVNNSSGVRTPMGNIYTGLLVILSLLFFTDYFFYIPKAALGGLIIAAVIFMVEYKVVKPMWRSKKSDLVPGLGAFFACLALPLELGILVGIGVNIIFVLYHAARPKIHIESLKTNSEKETKYLLITPDRCLIFPSVEYVRALINKQGIKSQVPIVIDASHVYGADFTAAKVVETLLKDFDRRNQQILFFNLKPAVASVFEGVKIQVFYEFNLLEKAIDSIEDDRLAILQSIRV